MYDSFIKLGVNLLSIFIMYSTDRAKALSYTISCLRDMDLYDKCQKTLVVDGKIDIVPPEWNVVQVPRFSKFRWSSMWDAGVCTARNKKVLYLDSDRLLPNNFLQMVVDSLKDNVFVFTSNHFMMEKDIDLDLCKLFLKDVSGGKVLGEGFDGSVRYEPRFKQPVHGPGKNVMSGSTAFTKETYFRLGGVDSWYKGHGAYADTDFHFTAAMGGCKFIDLGVPELHFPHSKLNKSNESIDEMTLRRFGLDNFIYYCDKWRLPMALAESLAHECGIKRPARYIERKIDDLRKSLSVNNSPVIREIYLMRIEELENQLNTITKLT